MTVKNYNYKKNNKNLFQYINSIYNFKLHKHNINMHIKKSSVLPLKKKLNKIKISNTKFPLSDRRIFSIYLRRNRILKNKKKANSIFNAIKNKQILRLKKKLVYLKKKIKFSSVYKKFVKNSRKPKVFVKSTKMKKIRFVLPWILQGREQQLKLQRTLMYLLFRLKKSQIKKNSKVAILTPQDSKLVKQYKRKAKFAKFGRYGTHGRSRIKFNKSNRFIKFKTKSVKPLANKIKRQQIYLQNKRLSMINNGAHILSHKYIYMLIIIWYILNNGFLILKKKMFGCEIWLNYFLKNVWIHQMCVPTNNWYLNYGTITNFKSIVQPITLYNSNTSILNHQLQPFKNYDRLCLGVFNRQSVNSKNKKSFKLKRRSKIRHFFKISPKLKNNKRIANYFFNKKTKKKVKIQKRLSAQEWLLMSKFTRKKYQDKFSPVFSQWKNVKQIQKYINKQSQVWHQPYFITHPYYYTNRYNTFIYQMAQE